MITTSQKERAKKIVEERRELEAKGKLLDLLLDFWEQANDAFSDGYNHITAIHCNADSKWTYYDGKQGEEMDTFSSKNVTVLEALEKTFKEIEKIPRDETYILKGSQSELQEMGFSLTITPKNFEMAIK